MSLFNYNSKEIHCKIIYFGPAGSGKTTNIKWIYHHTNQENQDPNWDVFSVPLRTKPSVSFDFLPIDIGKICGFQTRFHLYTVPDNKLLSESTKSLLLKGVDGVVFVADSSKNKMEANKKAFKELENYFSQEKSSLEKIPMAIQYNKRDLSNIYTLAQMRAQLNHYNHPDFQACAEKGTAVFETLKTVLKMVITVLKGSEFH